MTRGTIAAALAIICSFTPNVICADVRVAFVETKDPYTDALGLSEFLASEKVVSEDLSDEFSHGALPDLSNVDLLIVGSFITTNPQMVKGYREAVQSFADSSPTEASSQYSIRRIRISRTKLGWSQRGGLGVPIRTREPHSSRVPIILS